MQKIGQLFLLRTNINSVGSVLDSPVRKILSPIPCRHSCHVLNIGSVLGKLPSKSLCELDWTMRLDLSGPATSL